MNARAKTTDHTLDVPDSLSSYGCAVYQTIMDVLKKHELGYTGGCKAFYSPEEWLEDRGEQYGKGSELIVVYDGGDLRQFFNSNECGAHGYWTMFEEMIHELAKVGMYFEECTGWYCAIYRK